MRGYSERSSHFSPVLFFEKYSRNCVSSSGTRGRLRRRGAGGSNYCVPWISFSQFVPTASHPTSCWDILGHVWLCGRLRSFFGGGGSGCCRSCWRVHPRRLRPLPSTHSKPSPYYYSTPVLASTLNLFDLDFISAVACSNLSRGSRRSADYQDSHFRLPSHSQDRGRPTPSLEAPGGNSGCSKCSRGSVEVLYWDNSPQLPGPRSIGRLLSRWHHWGANTACIRVVLPNPSDTDSRDASPKSTPHSENRNWGHARSCWLAESGGLLCGIWSSGARRQWWRIWFWCARFRW